MAASITVYESFKEYLADGTIDLDTDTFKVTLHTSAYTPNAGTHTVYANLTNELSTANGYTNTGQTVAATWVRSGGTVTFDLADAVWTASGGSITARYAVVRKDGTANGIVSPLVAYILLDTTPADVTATATNTFTVQWNASGVFSLA